MNWSLLIGFAGLGLTVVGAAFAVVLKQAVAETRLTEQIKALDKAMTKAIEDLKAEHIRSAADQGQRLGVLVDEVGTLKDFKARMEGAAEREREMSGVVRSGR